MGVSQKLCLMVMRVEKVKRVRPKETESADSLREGMKTVVARSCSAHGYAGHFMSQVEVALGRD